MTDDCFGKQSSVINALNDFKPNIELLFDKIKIHSNSSSDRWSVSKNVSIPTENSTESSL